MKPSLENPRLTKRLLLEFSEQLFFLDKLAYGIFFKHFSGKLIFCNDCPVQKGFAALQQIRGVTSLDGARGKKQAWRTHV